MPQGRGYCCLTPVITAHHDRILNVTGLTGCLRLKRVAAPQKVGFLVGGQGRMEVGRRACWEEVQVKVPGQSLTAKATAGLPCLASMWASG